MGAFGEPRDARLYRRMRFIRRFEETLLGLFEEGLLERDHPRVHRPGSQRRGPDGAPSRRGPPLLQPPVPRPLPRLDGGCLRPARGDHGQARGALRGHRRQPAHLRAGLQVQRRPGRDRPRGRGHRAGRAAEGIRRAERRLPRRRHAGRRGRVRDAQPHGPVAAAAAAWWSKTTAGPRARRASSTLRETSRRASPHSACLSSKSTPPM